MKKHIYLLLLALYYLSTCYACNKGSIDDNPPPLPIDTTTMTTDTTAIDTTASDTIVYEDAPIWLPGDTTNGYAIGKKNGKVFEASAYSKYGFPPYNNVLFLYFNTYSQEGYRRESFFLGGILPDVVRNYAVNLDPYGVTDSIVHASYATLISDGDVVGDFHELDTLYDHNYLKIIEMNLANNMIKGIYNAAFINEEKNDKSDPRNPDYCVFEEVYFECKIIH